MPAQRALSSNYKRIALIFTLLESIVSGWRRRRRGIRGKEQNLEAHAQILKTLVPFVSHTTLAYTVIEFDEIILAVPLFLGSSLTRTALGIRKVVTILILQLTDSTITVF